MKFFGSRNLKKHRAFTLAELAIAMTLMSFVLLLAGSLIKLASTGFVGSEVQMTIVREDSAFAAKLNEAIQKSTVGFTVPYESFNNSSKLTKGWNYLGLMDEVHIPKAASRTGQEIASAQALVYIEYAGETSPRNVPGDCNVLHNADGYFIQKVLGHAFTDTNGVTHTYSLVFKPTDPVNTATQKVIYEFSANVDKGGVPLGSGADIEIDSMLSCLNAIQMVYRGSTVNPAVALAFRGDFMPTWAAQQASTSKPAATVILILDISNSMQARFGNTTRIQALRDNAAKLVEDLSKNEKINVLLAPFGVCGGDSNGIHTFNLGTQKTQAVNKCRSLVQAGSTNLGDGIRCALLELNRFKNTGAELGQIMMILMTDGDVNSWSYTGYYPSNGTTTNFYMGNWISYDGTRPTSSTYQYRGGNNYSNEKKLARDYVEIWANRLKNNYTIAKSYLLSLSDGMGAADKVLLEGIFGTEAININNLTDFQTVFEDIGSNIEEVLWAFEGPNL